MLEAISLSDLNSQQAKPVFAPDSPEMMSQFHNLESLLEEIEQASAPTGKTIVVMPAYNAAPTLLKTLSDLPVNVVDEIILVDDGSTDGTVDLALREGLTVIQHKQNRGYGGNQKTCYQYALEHGAEYVVMLHPDYQYDSRVVGIAIQLLKLGICDVVMGSRIRTRQEALAGGMPAWKYLANRLLTITENIVLGQNLGDFHSGFRAYRREVLETIPFEHNSNDFVFDSQFLAQAVYFDFRVGDIPVPVRYFPEASSINFRRCVKYGLGTLAVLGRFWAQKLRIRPSKIFFSKKIDTDAENRVQLQ
ncbi:glycosyltransferase family 2 protein [uncultured Gimesia sp.]|jgi:glycosyltransferase involved in cell wall biosynthesis|uniref:glycosyltransferase family 2 protein n=1 Tax=uncultured Gimesia sp. TaxID=1678688 RepID=UPI0026019F97|nr:glycosyltransferase family 2 protein [uncultured Gimesia sp.]